MFFFHGDNGVFATIREVSESLHDIIMGDTVSSDASVMDVDSQEATEEADVAQPPVAETSEATGSSGMSGQATGTLLGAEVPPGLLAIEDVKPNEYYQASDQIRGALNYLPDSFSRTWSPN